MNEQIVNGINITWIHRRLASKYNMPFDDVVSETSVAIAKAIMSLDSSKPNSAQLKYIYRSATWAIILYLKDSQKRSSAANKVEVCNVAKGFIPEDSSAEEKQILNEWLAILDDAEKKLLYESSSCGCPFIKNSSQAKYWMAKLRKIRLKIENHSRKGMVI